MPFLNNSWYCVSWTPDLDDKPQAIKLLDQDLALFRDSKGVAQAVSGVCPHRFAPMAKGVVVGDDLECPYHGLRFDGAGACTLNPHGRGVIPPRAKLRSYPCAERYGAIWVWMGDPKLAEEDTIPAFDFIREREGWAYLTGYLKVNANYQLVSDNLLDLTHGAYLHAKTLGLPPEESMGEQKMDYDFKTEGTTVHSNYAFYNVPSTALFEILYGKPRGDLHAHMTWYPASSLVLDISMNEVGKTREEGVHLFNAHLLAPETEDTCHYFYGISIRLNPGEEAKLGQVGQMAGYAFTQEDEPIIRDCYTLMRGKEFFSLEPAILETDIAGIQARRILNKLITKENNTASESEESASGSIATAA
jgi:phenylpropionate dioxygenase-like ring-hydroxylating dioxygenase large terminal subunit